MSVRRVAIQDDEPAERVQRRIKAVTRPRLSLVKNVLEVVDHDPGRPKDEDEARLLPRFRGRSRR